MNTTDFISSSAPLIIFFLLSLVLYIRSVRACLLTCEQMVAGILIGLANLFLMLCVISGPSLYVGMAMAVAMVGINLAGLLLQRRKRKRA